MSISYVSSSTPSTHQPIQPISHSICDNLPQKLRVRRGTKRVYYSDNGERNRANIPQQTSSPNTATSPGRATSDTNQHDGKQGATQATAAGLSHGMQMRLWSNDYCPKGPRSKDISFKPAVSCCSCCLPASVWRPGWPSWRKGY